MTLAGSQLRRVLAIAALGSLPVLSGCVAAAAIPVVAASGVLGKKILNGRQRPGETQPRTAIAISPPPAVTVENSPPGAIIRTAEFSDGSKVEVSMPARVSSVGAVKPDDFAPPPSPPPAPLTGRDPVSVAKPAQSALSATSAPGSIGGSGGPPPAGWPGIAGPKTADYGAFARYAGVVGNVPVIGTERHSAMLADPGALSATTRMCSIQPAAVMVDLDPAGGIFDPARADHADPALAEALARIRGESVIVAWVSSVTADKADLVRKALVRSGLDPAGKDELVLLRFPEERKQTRRTDLAKELCIVAIAGDDRSDFDELYDYLKDPAVARDLEALVGNGWFLIPQPLTSN